jgi:hypothetical protein
MLVRKSVSTGVGGSSVVGGVDGGDANLIDVGMPKEAE